MIETITSIQSWPQAFAFCVAAVCSCIGAIGAGICVVTLFNDKKWPWE